MRTVLPKELRSSAVAHPLLHSTGRLAPAAPRKSKAEAAAVTEEEETYNLSTFLLLLLLLRRRCCLCLRGRGGRDGGGRKAEAEAGPCSPEAALPWICAAGRRGRRSRSRWRRRKEIEVEIGDRGGSEGRDWGSRCRR
jgi:hypothetical protein